MRFLLLSFIVSLHVYADDFEDGRTLYLEAKCQECHLQDSKFDPNSIKKEGTNFKATDLKQIKKWVINCDNYFDIGWFPEEQENVANYLNKNFYKHKNKKAL